MSNVTNNGVILHLHEVLASQDVRTPSGGHEDVTLRHGVLDSSHLVTFHSRLESVDWIHLSDDHTAAKASERLCATLADISITGNKCDLEIAKIPVNQTFCSIISYYLSGQHNICGSLDTVNKGFSASIKVIKL